MNYRILWLEDATIHHLPADLALDLPEDAPTVEIVYATRGKEARGALKAGTFDAIIIDTELNRGDAPEEDGLVVVEQLIKGGLIRADTPRVVWSGTTRDGYEGKAKKELFPYWVPRNTGREVLQKQLFRLLLPKVSG